MKLNLTYVNRIERTSKNTGKPFTSVSIKAKEYGDKFISGFGNKDNASWKVGDEVEVANIIEVPKDGKVYLNFEMVKTGNENKALGQIDTRLGLLTSKIDKIIDHLSGKDRLDRTSDGGQMPDFGEGEEDGFGGY